MSDRLEDRDKQDRDRGRDGGDNGRGHDRDDDRGREVKPPRPHGSSFNEWCS